MESWNIEVAKIKVLGGVSNSAQKLSNCKSGDIVYSARYITQLRIPTSVADDSQDDNEDDEQLFEKMNRLGLENIKLRRKDVCDQSDNKAKFEINLKTENESVLEKVEDVSESDCKALLEDTYVDDCLSGADSEGYRTQMIEDLQLALCPAGFTVKGFTCSGSLPPDELTKDGVSVKVAGAKWFSKPDKISLESGDMGFSTKSKGKKSSERTVGVPENLTRVQCASKVAELFDLVGLATPITFGWKVDLRTLVDGKLD